MAIHSVSRYVMQCLTHRIMQRYNAVSYTTVQVKLMAPQAG